MLDISTTLHPSAAILHLQGRIDSASSRQLEQIAATQIDNGHLKLILDFEQVDYISSAGLRSVLLITHKLIDLSGSLTVCNLNPSVLTVFEITGFSKIISHYSSLEDTLLHL